MIVVFESVRVLDVVIGESSKTGRKYGRLVFVTKDDYQTYEIFVGERDLVALSSINKGDDINKIPFELLPDRRNGVRIVPAW